MLSRDFIEVTSVLDGRKAAIRAACIDAVIDNGEERQDYGMKPRHVMISYGGTYIDVTESYEDVCDMIFNAEM